MGNYEQKLGQYLDRVLQNENNPAVNHLMEVESEFAAKRKHVSTNEELKPLIIDSILKIDKSALEQMVEDPAIMFAYFKKSISDKQEIQVKDEWEKYIGGGKSLFSYWKERPLSDKQGKKDEHDKDNLALDLSVWETFSSNSLILAYATAELDGEERKKFLEGLIDARISKKHPYADDFGLNYQTIAVKVVDTDGRIKAEGTCQGIPAFVNQHSAYVRAYKRAVKFKGAYKELRTMMEDFRMNDSGYFNSSPYRCDKRAGPESRFWEAMSLSEFYSATQNTFFMNFFSSYTRLSRPNEELLEDTAKSDISFPLSWAKSECFDSPYTINFIKDQEIEIKETTDFKKVLGWRSRVGN